MKLENKNHSHEAIIGVQESNALRISQDSQAMIIDSLINLYSDPVGSVVRELTSNCIDAHRERELKLHGKVPLADTDDLSWFDDRLTVSVSLMDSNPLLNLDANISFNDYGIGLSPQRVKDIYTVLGTSTKRDDNHQIGGFGLGCKSPWAYVDQFYVNTRYNGTEYYYLMHKGESVPAMDLVYKKETTQKNGTSVIIPLKSSYSNEINKFVSSINEQLPFFEHVVYDGFEDYSPIKSWNIEADHQDYVIHNSDTPYKYKMLVGNVVYPLETDQLDEVTYNDISIDLSPDLVFKFKIGELDLVPSREAVRYTPKTKDAILNKISNVLDGFKKEVETEVKQLDDLYEAYLFYKQLNRYSYGSPRINNFSTLAFKSAMLKSSEFNIDLSKWDLDIPGVTVQNFIEAFNPYKLQRDYSSRGNSSKVRAHSVGVENLFDDKKTTIYSVADKFNFRTNEAIFEGGIRTAYAFKWRSFSNSSTTAWKSVGYKFNFTAVEEEKHNVIGKSLLEYTLEKIQVSLKKHFKIPGVIVYEDIDTSSVSDDIAEQEETPDQRRRRLGKLFFRYVKSSYYDSCETDVIDVTSKGEITYIYGHKDDIKTLRDIYNIITEVKEFKTFKVISIAKHLEKHMARHIHFEDFMQYDERWKDLLDKFLNKLYVNNAFDTYVPTNLLSLLNKEVYTAIKLRNIEIGDISYEHFMCKYGKDFTPSSSNFEHVTRINHWFSKMSILNSNIINTNTYTFDYVGIKFLADYMEKVEADTTLVSKELNFEEAVKLAYEISDRPYNVVSTLYTYPDYQMVRDKIDDAESDEDKLKIIMFYKDKLVYNAKEKLGLMLLRDHKMLVSIDESAVSQLSLQLENL